MKSFGSKWNWNGISYYVLLFSNPALFLSEIGAAFTNLGKDPNCRVIILSGAGKIFSAGIDLGALSKFFEVVTGDDQDASRYFYDSW